MSPTPQPQAGGFMSDARRLPEPQAPASSPPPRTSLTGRAASAPSRSAEAAANDAGQSRVAKEELMQEVAGGPPRAAPASEGRKVRDPWASLKDAKEASLSFADFAAKTVADLEGDIALLLQGVLTANVELISSRGEINKRYCLLKKDCDAKDVRIAELEAARQKDEASDLAAVNLALKEEHQKAMEAQQLKFAQETSQLIGELDSLRKKLADVEKAAAEEISKQTSRVQTAEDALSTHVLEFSAFHDLVLVVGLGDDKVISPRQDRLARLGELITETLAVSKRFAAKFFISSDSQEPTDFSDVPNMLDQATRLHKSSLKSATRGGAKTALGLFMAHYPEAEIDVVTEGMLSTYEDGSEIQPAAVLNSVAGYATLVADMVDTTVFFKRHPVPRTREDVEVAATT